MGYNLEPIENEDVNLRARFGGEQDQESLRPQEDHVKEPGKENVYAEPVQHEKIVVQEKPFSPEKDQTYQSVLQQVQATDDADGGHIAQDASDTHMQHDRESQVNHLVNIATTKGVEHAVKVAEHMEDYYVLDQFHDMLLSEEFHRELQARGLMPE